MLVAKALEELGKLNLEESSFVESFANLNESYEIFSSLANCEEDIERIQALLCFLHRKIEHKISGQNEKVAQDDTELRILNNQQLKKEIDKFGDGFKIDDSFSFLKEAGLGAHTMLQVFAKKIAQTNEI